MKYLQLSVHDASPAWRDTLEDIHELLEGLGARRYSMLVVPDLHGKWPLEEHPEFCSWLSGIAGRGVEILLHGYSHMDSGGRTGPTGSLRKAMFTRGEGEFLSLDQSQAGDLIRAGREKLRETLGIEVKGFVAPAWLYSRGTMKALKEEGFTACENRWRIWNPATGDTALWKPVANYAGGGHMKRSLAGLWVRVYAAVCRNSRILRFAVHPSDFQSDSRRERVLDTLSSLLGERETLHLSSVISAP